MVQTQRLRHDRMDRARITLGAGWLTANPALPADNHGITVPRWSLLEEAPFPTRREEYVFAAAALDNLSRGWVVDAGAGFNEEIHLLPQIVGEMGFDVVAVDAHSASLDMPEHVKVTRVVSDLRKLPRVVGGYGAWLCISVLEHLPPQIQQDALHEALRVLAPGGLAILTVDELEPAQLNDMLQDVGFEIGVVAPFAGPHLTPRVAWAVARKGG